VLICSPSRSSSELATIGCASPKMVAGQRPRPVSAADPSPGHTTNIGGIDAQTMRPYVASWSRHILSLRRVLFSGFFRHKFAANGPQDVKMVQKDASRNSTQSVIKICSYKLKYWESNGTFSPQILGCRTPGSGRRTPGVRHQLVTGTVSLEPLQIET
jgi:hypothetical protein